MSDVIQVMYGEKELIIKPPVIRQKFIERKWWFNKIEYWIELEYVSLGPYNHFYEAFETWQMIYAHTK